MSKGAQTLLEIVRNLYPSQRIITEYHIGKKLFLDIYLPFMRLAFEYDGRQHQQYVEHFHGSRAGFTAGLQRDALKAELCAEQDIVLLTFSHNDELTQTLVTTRITEALHGKHGGRV